MWIGFWGGEVWLLGKIEQEDMVRVQFDVRGKVVYGSVRML